MLKKIFTTKLVIIPISIVLIIILGIVGFILFGKHMTELERVKITDDSKTLVYNIDEVIERDFSDESYIMFALEYLKQTKGGTVFSLYEVRDVIANTFEKGIDHDTIIATGITPYMVGRGVTFDSATNCYSYNKTYTRVDINNMPVVKYSIKKISKKNSKKYVVTYDKYVVDNPYSIYDYYISNSNDQEHINIINEYLKGTGNSNKVKDLITNDNIDKIGSRKGQIKITFIVKDSKLKISKIEK